MLTAGILASLAAIIAAEIQLRWIVGPALLHPGRPGTFDEVSVKDPSIVRHEGRWHLFYTARDQTDYTLGYVSAGKLEDLSRSTRHQLLNLHASASKYAAAPQVFYFRPQKRWYLIFQTTDSTYLPVYSTSEDIDNPAAWSSPKPLVDKQDAAKWIDFWVICDSERAYLFFTRSHQDVAVMSTRLEDFPNGFGAMRTVFKPVHEAVHVYAVKGKDPLYVMLYEQNEGDRRRFGLARASALTGPWTKVTDRFASGEQLSYRPGQSRWTGEVSHGELLRSGWDERLEVASDRWDFLVQGMAAAEHKGEYPLLPWRLGLISLNGVGSLFLPTR